MFTNPVKFIVRKVGKGVSKILLAMASLGFSTYAWDHFPFWGSALSFILMVCCFVPMILHFNLFLDVFLGSGSSRSKGYQFHREEVDIFERRAQDRLFDDD